MIRQSRAAYRLNGLTKDLQTLQINNAANDLFEANLVQKLNYNQSSACLLSRHFLTTLEDYIGWFNRGANGRPRLDMTKVWDLNQITTEHIYPQNAVSPIPALEPLKHDIGNLTFWAPYDNRAAGNNSFAAKRNRYEQSNVILTQELARLSE
jgi:hypothetical protein